ncbi:MAG: sigma factor-like helix-turn-helix DNA-binding protein, partial [Planctomycetota bacterium]
ATRLRRYPEGLSAAAIARREGVPESTIRSRLARALAELRMRLDERAGGDRQRWGFWLAPLAACGEERTASAALAGSGGIVVWIGLAGGAALVAGLLLSRSEEPTELLAPVARVAAQRAPVGSSATPPAGLREALAGTELDSARVSSEPAVGEWFSLRARLVDEDGTALAAGSLGLFEPRAEADLVAIASARAGVDGWAELRALRATLVTAPALFATGHAPGHARVFMPLARAQLALPELELGELCLAPGGDVAGRVVDADGRPLAGAVLVVSRTLGVAGPQSEDARRLWPLVEPLAGPYLPCARSDESGAFEIVGVPSGSLALVARSAPDGPALLPARVEPLAIGAGERTEVGTLVLSRPEVEETIAGSVVDGEARPLAGIFVSIEDGGVKVPGGAVSRADGSFTLLVPRARQWSLRARDPERRWMPADVGGVASGARDVRLVLVPAPEPHVSTAAAEPIGPSVATPAFTAELVGRLTLGGVSPGSWSVHVGTQSTQLDATGGFRLRALSPGKASLTIRSGFGGDVETFLAAECVLEDGPNAWELDLPAATLTLENLPEVGPAEDEPAVADTPEFLLEGTLDGASVGILFQELADPRRTLTRVPAGRWKLSRRADGFRFGGEARWLALVEFELLAGETRRVVLP